MQIKQEPFKEGILTLSTFDEDGEEKFDVSYLIPIKGKPGVYGSGYFELGSGKKETQVIVGRCSIALNLFNHLIAVDNLSDFEHSEIENCELDFKACPSCQYNIVCNYSS